MHRGGRNGYTSPVLALALLAGSALGQGTSKPEAFEPVDPYTRAEAKALERAGYVTLSPVEWAQGIRTDEVKETLGGIDIIWIETAHFRIGSTLESYKVPADPKEDDKLEAELARLKKKLARFKDPKNKLDPWMRIHLYAQRLEDVYAGFEKSFGLSAADFPDADGRKPSEDAKLGLGPYLGRERKFTVLLLEKTSSLARFAKRYADREERPWDRFPLPGGSVFLGVTAEGMKQYGFELDAALHCQVAAEATHNFINGFRGSWSDSPLWLECGLAHAAARRVDERFVPSVMGAPTAGDPDAWKWEPRVRGLVENAVAKSWPEMLGWNAWEDVKLQGHLVAWSRASWLLDKGPAALKTFLLAVTEPLPEGEGEALAKAALEREGKACQAAFGKDLAAMEAEWKKHVQKRYPKN
ncbi:MAG: hypothetical protein ACKVXR_13395 [Planctomycetota bacterium]